MHRAIIFKLKICFLLGQHSVILITNQLFAASLIIDARFLSGIRNSSFEAVSMDKTGHQGKPNVSEHVRYSQTYFGSSSLKFSYSRAFPTDTISICSKIDSRQFPRFHVSHLHSKPNVSISPKCNGEYNALGV